MSIAPAKTSFPYRPFAEKAGLPQAPEPAHGDAFVFGKAGNTPEEKDPRELLRAMKDEKTPFGKGVQVADMSTDGYGYGLGFNSVDSAVAGIVILGTALSAAANLSGTAFPLILGVAALGLVYEGGDELFRLPLDILTTGLANLMGKEGVTEAEDFLSDSLEFQGRHYKVNLNLNEIVRMKDFTAKYGILTPNGSVTFEDYYNSALTYHNSIQRNSPVNKEYAIIDTARAMAKSYRQYLMSQGVQNERRGFFDRFFHPNGIAEDVTRVLDSSTPNARYNNSLQYLITSRIPQELINRFNDYVRMGQDPHLAQLMIMRDATKINSDPNNNPEKYIQHEGKTYLRP